jgi:putative glutamine amidotransferase
MSTPFIGVCASMEVARWRMWETMADLLPRVYSLSIQRAGGTSLLLPPDDAVAQAPDDLLDRLDALLLAGGSDVDPAAYGARPHPRTGPTRPERDRFELALTHGALERDMPVLGVCRGMELLNIALGGTLIQHLPDVTGDERHLHTPGAFSDHEVRLEPGSLAARAVGAERTSVKSHHHQAPGELGEGLVESGWSEPDRLVEAIEVPDRRFALGVLWHPEEDERSRVIGSFVEAARAKVATA